MPPAEVVGALLVFRLYYYIVPLFIAGALFAGFEIGAAARTLLARFARRAAASRGAGGAGDRGARRARPARC